MRRLAGLAILSSTLAACGGNGESGVSGQTVTASVRIATLGAISSNACGEPNPGLLAAENSGLVYERNDGQVHFKSTSTSPVNLTQIAGCDEASSWVATSGRVFATIANGQVMRSSISVWSTDGSPLSSLTDSAIAGARWPWALEIPLYPRGSSMTLWNVSTGETISIGPPGGPVFGFVDGDFIQASGQLSVYYSFAAAAAIDIYRRDQRTGTSARVTTGRLVAAGPATDGTSVAWGESSDAAGQYSLHLLDIASNTEATLSRTMSQFYLADGLLAWQEGSPFVGAIKMWNGLTITALSTQPTGLRLYGTSGGTVLLREENKLYARSASASQLLFDGPAGQALI